jgi:glutamyl-Q tRNA(Asp) synthetase
VITHANGDKLSKLTAAPAIPLNTPAKTLCAALVALRQEPPAKLSAAELSEVWSWALETWQMGNLLGCKAIVEPIVKTA